MFIVFDLDGTLALIEHRRHLVEKSDRGNKPNWRAFYAACVNDTPHVAVVKLFRALYATPGVQLEIWSGRSEEVRKKTEEWLSWHVFYEKTQWRKPGTAYVQLLMRKEGDFTPDDQLKRSWLDQLWRERGITPAFVVDDRDKVVNMWRAAGVTCLQCAPGGF